MPNLTFSELEALVGEAGGTPTQQEYLAAIAAGVESGGDPTAQNPTSTASGLWQELTTTWEGNGGGAYAPTASGASPLDQAIVAVNQSKGGYQPWAPDFGGAYGAKGNAGNPQSPAAGSPVANFLKSIGVSSPGTAPIGSPGAPPAGGASATDAGFDLNPLNLFGIPQTLGGAAGAAAGSVAGDIWQEVGPFLVKSMLVVAGIGVVVLGLAKLTDAPEKIQSAQQHAPELAELAAA